MEGWVILKYVEAQKRFTAAVMAAVMAAGTMGAGFTAVAQADTAYADEAAIVTLAGTDTAATDTETTDTIDISTVKWPDTYKTYTGSAITPFDKSTNKVMVNGEKTKLVEGTDYTVEYQNNIEVGTATAIITGIGNYSGTLTVNFDISYVHFDIVQYGKTVYSFSESDLTDLAASSTDNKVDVYYQYQTTGASMVAMVEAGNYITYSTLLKAAGISNADNVYIAAADGFGNSFSLSELANGKYFPAQGIGSYVTEDAVSVPAALAMGYWKTEITTTAAEAIKTIKEDSKNYVTGLNNVCGALESDYKEGNIPGNRFVSEPRTLKVTSYDASTYNLSDVDSWATDYVTQAITQGYITGYNNTIDAKGTLTRAMVATILYRAAGCPAVTTNAGFTDTSAETWYQDAINWAAEQGIVTGYTDANGKSNGLFGTYDNITRQDLATMLARYAKNILGEDTNVTSANAMAAPDWSSVATYAKAPMQWAYEKGVLTGTDKGYLAANDTATREQMAKMIINMLK